MKELMSLFYPQILLLKDPRGEKPFFACLLVSVGAAAIQLVQDVRKHLIKFENFDSVN